MTLPGPLTDYRTGYARGYYRADRLGRGLASFRAIQATVNLLLVASGRWPEKRGDGPLGPPRLFSKTKDIFWCACDTCGQRQAVESGGVSVCPCSGLVWGPKKA